jgi:hypothetical protein
MLRIAFVFVSMVLVFQSCACKGPELQEVTTPPEIIRSCAPVAEVCNGLDDDCDGAVDEELPVQNCGVGACRREVPSCQAGALVACTPGSPVPETCNGIDDNCDGAVDERLMPQQCGVGECAVVQASCTAGRPVACLPSEDATDEVCNGKDDNCNGTVDEGLVTNTSGDLRITNNQASSDFVYIGKGESGFGLVWQDKRGGSAGQIYFAELSNQGVRVSNTDRRVSNTEGTSTHPALAWNGDSWGLVYADNMEGSEFQLYFRKLNASGQPSASAVRVTQSSGNSDWPDVVWTGEEYAIAYDDQRAGRGKHDIYFQRLDRNGARLGSEVRVTTDPARQSNPILKWNGTEFALTWMDNRHIANNNNNNREIYFRRLASDGSFLGPEVRVSNDSSDSAWPDLTWNDVNREWALVWHSVSDGNTEVYFSRLDSEGLALGGEEQLTNAPGFSGYPSIDWNGYEYGVSWQDDRGAAGKASIYFSQVSAMGNKAGTDLKLSTGSGNASFTTALWNGSTFALCWRDDRQRAPNTEIYFALVGCPQ